MNQNQIAKKIESVCSCETCKNMCRRQPCIGTPDDIVKIIEKGYGDKLSLSYWCTGLVKGVVDKPIKMLQPTALANGHCAFLDKEGLCTLHNLGLKPTEGKIAHHSDSLRANEDFKETINYQVAMTWVDEKGKNDPFEMLLNSSKKLKIT